MTTENLVTIDFDSELASNNNEIDVNDKNSRRSSNFHSQEIDLIPDVSYKDHHGNLEDVETIVGESQPLLGGDHHEHITYNQFPGKIQSSDSQNDFFLLSFPMRWKQLSHFAILSVDFLIISKCQM